MTEEELIKLLKHFRDDFERVQRCYCNPNIDEDEYALDDGKDLVEICEEAINELTTLIGGHIFTLDKHHYDIWDDEEDKKSNFEKAFDKVVANHLNEDKGAWNEAKREPTVAEMMGEYSFQPAVLPKDDKGDKHDGK